jgi:NDP-sugar pyrophosphorylase family protein
LRKPDPKFHQHAAFHLGLPPAEILMIGDSWERDIKPARALGMRTVWLKSDAAASSEADAVLDSLTRVPPLLPPNAQSSSAIKAGIFAAGQGSRLRSVGQLKPLVRIGDRPLIAHVLDSFAQLGVGEVTIIINEEAVGVQDAIVKCEWPFELRWIVKTTPSSMESFLRVVEALAAGDGNGPFLLSTVDTVLPPGALPEFFQEACKIENDVALAVNTPAEDDNPLWIRCGARNSRVLAMGEGAAGSGLATAGVYAVRPTILREASAARRDQIGSLRKFLGRLLERGYSILAVPIANSVDVDRPPDIIAAERLVNEKRL